MPKHVYDEHYGALSILPFPFCWISLLMMPCLICVKSRTTLQKINAVCCYLAYTPIFLCVLAVFIAVNFILLPLAYLKTLLHKLILVRRVTSRSNCGNLGIYMIFGVPFLLCAQLNDIYRFLVHTFDTK